eukprot:jgi/Chlat1/7520/Chrsp61S07012
MALKRAFDEADTDGSGALDQEEFLKAFRSVQGGGGHAYSSSDDVQLAHLFMKIDANSDGTVDWDEFTNHILLEQQARSDETGGEATQYVRIVGRSENGGGVSKGGHNNKGGGHKKGGGSGNSTTTTTTMASTSVPFVKTTVTDRLLARGIPAASETGSGSGFNLGRRYNSNNINNNVGLRGEDATVERIAVLPLLDAYVSAGRDGSVRVWQSALHASSSWSHSSSSSSSSSSSFSSSSSSSWALIEGRSQPRGAGTWVTDVAVMCEQPLAAFGADRSVAFYDTGRASLDLLARVVGLDSVPTAGTYVRLSDKDLLLYGDDVGCVHTFSLADSWGGPAGNDSVPAVSDTTQPNTNITTHTSSMNMNSNNVATVEVGVKRLPGMIPNPAWKCHTDWVTHVSHLAHSNSLLTCGLDGYLRLADLERRRSKWGVKSATSGAVYCADFCRAYNFIASCGLGRSVQLWNPFTGRSVGSLSGHSSSVLCVRVIEPESQLASLSADGVVKLWDVRNNRCVQTIGGNSSGEISSLAVDVERRALVLAAGERLEIWAGMTTATSSSSSSTSSLSSASALLHFNDTDAERRENSALVAAIYNSAFRQVVTGACDGSVSVWSVESGDCVFAFSTSTSTSSSSSTTTTKPSSSHLSAMCFDPTGRRLLAATQEGALRLWNFNNGACLAKFAGMGGTEVTCVAAVRAGGSGASGGGAVVFAAGGWNRKVCIWHDGAGGDDASSALGDDGRSSSSASFNSNNNTSSPSPHMLEEAGAYLPHHTLSAHRDDVIAMCCCHASGQQQTQPLLATASYDGALLLWKLDGQLKHVVRDNNNNKGHAVALVSLSKLPNPCLLACTSDASLHLYRLSPDVHEVGVVVAEDALDALACACADGETNERVYTAGTDGVVRAWRVDKSVVGVGSTASTPRAGVRGAATGMGASGSAMVLEFAWKAHWGAVLHMEWVEGSRMLLTASVDSTCRLWTDVGRLVGVFGSKIGWNIDDPATFAHAAPVYLSPTTSSPDTHTITTTTTNPEPSASAAGTQSQEEGDGEAGEGEGEDEVDEEEYERQWLAQQKAWLLERVRTGGRKQQQQMQMMQQTSGASPANNATNATTSFLPLSMRLPTHELAPVDATVELSTSISGVSLAAKHGVAGNGGGGGSAHHNDIVAAASRKPPARRL